MTAALPLLALLLWQYPTTLQVPTDDPLATNAEIRMLVDERIGRGLPQLQRLEALLDMMFDAEEVGFRYEARTKTAVDTFRDRSGNCLSFTSLFVSMARYLGLRAQFREVVMAPTWNRHGRVIVMGAHVNVLVQIGSRSYVVDLFPELDRVTLGGMTISDERARAHYYSNIGAEYLAAGDPARAIAYYRHALDQDSRVGFVWVNLGVAHTMAGQFEEARGAYETALDIDHKDLLAVSNLGRLYERMGDGGKAAEYRDRAEKFQRKNPYYHFYLGEERFLAGDFIAAAESYRSALRLKPEDHGFHFALARAYVRLNEAGKAARELQLALQYAPRQFELRYARKLELLLARN